MYRYKSIMREYRVQKIKYNLGGNITMENKFYFSEDNRESLPDIMDRSFTENQLKEVYQDIIDKTEYKDFSEWFFDMLKSGLIIHR